MKISKASVTTEISTDEAYSFLWRSLGGKLPGCRYKMMQEAIPEKIVSGKIGLEVGCGCGVDAKAMAEESPDTEIVALDISESVHIATRLCQNLKNVRIVRASALKLPFPDKMFDFCYSYGVIHHTPDPGKCFSEIRRVLKSGKYAFFYLYEDHAKNMFKKYSLKIVTLIRRITLKLDKRALYFLSMLASPMAFIIFTIPARLLRIFSGTRNISDNMPFNFGKGPFSLGGDIYDRFGAPIELRFNRSDLRELLEKSGFCDIQFAKLKTNAGHVVWAKNR